jgi:hypothetical protein
MSVMNMGKDVKGRDTYALPFCEDNYLTTLAQGVVQTLTVPTEYAWYEAVFFFQPGSTIYVSNGPNLALPGASFAKTYAQGRPTVRRVKGGSILKFICADEAAEMGVSFYGIQHE